MSAAIWGEPDDSVTRRVPAPPSSLSDTAFPLCECSKCAPERAEEIDRAIRRLQEINNRDL